MVHVTGGGGAAKTRKSQEAQQPQEVKKAKPAAVKKKAPATVKDDFNKTGATKTAKRPAATPAQVKADPKLSKELKQAITQQHIAPPSAKPAHKTEKKEEPKQEGGWKFETNLTKSDLRGGEVGRAGEQNPMDTNVRGTTFTRGGAASTGGGRRTSSWESKSVETKGGLNTTHAERDGSARNVRTGQSIRTLTSETQVQDRKTGVALKEETTVKERNGNNQLHSHTENSQSGPNSRFNRIKQNINENSNVNATLYSKEAKLEGSVYSKQFGHDPGELKTTGAGAKVDFLHASLTGSAAVNVDLRRGQLNAGVQGSAEANLVKVEGRAQLGNSNKIAAVATGTARVGATATGGAQVILDPRKGSAKVAVGGEAFAGAEAKGTVGVETRYGGANAEGRLQAGIGANARVEAGIEHGRFKAKVDLGLCVGVGARVSFNVDINVGKIASDAKAVASSAWSGVKSGWHSLFG